jgi:hypothetical protein
MLVTISGARGISPYCPTLLPPYGMPLKSITCLLTPINTNHALILSPYLAFAPLLLLSPCPSLRAPSYAKYIVESMPLSSPVLLRAPISRARALSPRHHHIARCTPIRNAHLPKTFLKFSSLTPSFCDAGSPDVAFSMSVEGVLYIFAQNGYMKLLPKQSLFALNNTCKKVFKITSAIVSFV